MNDFALLRLKLSIFCSPFNFFVCNVAPALLADRTFFAFDHDVKFYVFTVAGFLPWIFAMFHFLVSNKFDDGYLVNVAFKGRPQPTLTGSGEG